MYQKYQTEALVLKSSEQGEADKLFSLYTKDFGLIRARASAVRQERSRMRYALQNYARAHVSLVKGRRGWRVAGASALAIVSGAQPGTAVFARIAALVLRLVHGDEQNDYLYETLVGAQDALMQAPPAAVTVEIVCVARVLFALGYLSADALETELFTHTTYAVPHLAEAEGLYEELLSSVNKAIAETQL